MPSSNSVWQPTPDLIDFFVILLLAVAIDIAIFWLGTQFVSSPVFQQLPTFVTGAFSGVWTSVATGATGIGLAIVKSVTSREASRPNYPIYVLVAAVFILVAAYSAALTSFVLNRDRNQELSPPLGAQLIDPDKINGKTIDFDIESPDSAPQMTSYRFVGTYVLKDGHITGRVTKGTFTTTDQFVLIAQVPLKLTRAAIQLCYIHKITGVPGYNGQWGMQGYPPVPRSRNATDLAIPIIEKNKEVALPPFNFSFDLPGDYERNRGWLCGALYNGVGYFPSW